MKHIVDRQRRDLFDRLAFALGRIDVPDAHGSFPIEAMDRLRSTGILAATLPKGSAGGFGLSEPESSETLRAVLVRVGQASQVLGRLYEGHVNAHALVFRYGDAEACERTIRDTADGHLFGVWNTEPAKDGLVLNAAGDRLTGSKMFASGAGFVTRPLVTTRDADGRSRMFIAPLEEGERSDLSAWSARGMRASATGSVSFEGYPLSRAIGVGRADDYHKEPFFSAGAWRFLAVHLGGMEGVHHEHKAHLLRLGPKRGSSPAQAARAVRTRGGKRPGLSFSEQARWRTMPR